jgi:Topoisomerase IA
VQEITQRLYEKKLISCPRTSSRLMPGDMYDMLPPVMEKLMSGKEYRQYAGMIDLAARKGVTGNQDTAEHHAIVITGIQPGELGQGGKAGLNPYSRQDARKVHAALQSGIYNG